MPTDPGLQPEPTRRALLAALVAVAVGARPEPTERAIDGGGP